MAQWYIQTIPPTATLSYNITIHKSQGQTLSKAVIDIGDKEMTAGCTFVAVSSLTDFNL